MKTFININRVFTQTSSVIRRELIRLEGDHSLSSLMNTVGWKLIILSLGTIRKATSRIRLYHKFSTYILVMTRRHGPEFTVKYLKACNLAVSKFLAGQPFKSLRDIEPDLPLPRLSKSGLPVIIGTRDRRSLHANSHRVIRLWLTLFSLYRIIRIPAKAKLNTITDPFSGNSKFLEIAGNWMEHNASTMFQRFYPLSNFKLQETFSIGESASPSNSKSWVGMLTDISLLKSSPDFFASFVRVMELTCSARLVQMFKTLALILPDINSPKFWLLPMKDGLLELLSYHLDKKGPIKPLIGLGQLQQKEEAAGKMRTFAMVDSWTQTILLPVHTFISNLLSKLPNDGTADHGKAFERVMTRSKEFGCSYGYDLSAATDRLPISLQIKLLSGLFGKDFANDWAKILVGRPYTLISTGRGKPTTFTDYWYKVGQPMGARSSFVMLGLTHHMIVQYCAHILGVHGWETRYEIVGDDIIIFNKDLALKYLEVMNLIGVPINESKSVVSENRPVAEFVKRVAVNGRDVSPFSWKQFISQDNFLGRISTTIGLFKKELVLAEKAISVFHTIMKERIYDSRPLKDTLSYISLLLTYSIKSNMPIQDIMMTLFSFRPQLDNSKLIFNRFDFHKVGSLIKKLILTNKAPEDAIFAMESVTINQTLTLTYFKKILEYRKSWWSGKVTDCHHKIISHIMGRFIHIDKYNRLLPVSDHKISDDILVILKDWINWQDPKDGDKGYPWLYSLVGNIDFNTKKIRADDILNTLYSNFPELSGRLGHLRSRINAIRSNDLLFIAWTLHQECLGKLTFLQLPDRVNEQPKERLFEISDNTFLKDLVKISKIVKKEKKRALPFGEREVSIGISIFR
nr:MAG: putative RNA dependent RNA polymerase [Henan mito-like virus 36]